MTVVLDTIASLFHSYNNNNIIIKTIIIKKIMIIMIIMKLIIKIQSIIIIIIIIIIPFLKPCTFTKVRNRFPPDGKKSSTPRELPYNSEGINMFH